MALRTSVKVGCISNLSDARYCAGMGVELLGFRTVEGQDHYVNPTQYQEIRGWFSGPKIVAELYGITTVDQLESVLRDYQPDLLELSIHDLTKLDRLPIDTILSTTYSEYQIHKQTVSNHKDQIAYLLLPDDTSVEQLTELAGEFGILLQQTDSFSVNLLDLPIQGIALEGSLEEKPGLKSYEQLANVLEMLDENA